jgi:hypothetical protein
MWAEINGDGTLLAYPDSAAGVLLWELLDLDDEAQVLGEGILRRGPIPETFEPALRGITCLAFSADGSRLRAATRTAASSFGRGGAARLWHADGSRSSRHNLRR